MDLNGKGPAWYWAAACGLSFGGHLTLNISQPSSTHNKGVRSRDINLWAPNLPLICSTTLHLCWGAVTCEEMISVSSLTCRLVAPRLFFSCSQLAGCAGGKHRSPRALDAACWCGERVSQAVRRLSSFVVHAVMEGCSGKTKQLV